jgi:hypothetical protein
MNSKSFSTRKKKFTIINGTFAHLKAKKEKKTTDFKIKKKNYFMKKKM